MPALRAGKCKIPSPPDAAPGRMLSMSSPTAPAGLSWDLSYRTKLLAGVCGLVLLTGAAVTWLAHRSARVNAERLVDKLFREVSGHAVTHTRGFVHRAEPLVESMRNLAGSGLALDDSDRLAHQLLAFLEGNPGLSWVSYGDEAGSFTGVYRTPDGGLRVNQSHIVGGRTRLVEKAVQPDGSWRTFHQEDDSGYDPRTRPFYRKAKEADRLVWLPPYMFRNPDVPGITCAAPVQEAGRLRGVITADFTFDTLSDFTARLRLSEHSRVFLFTDDGKLLAHPDRRPTGAELPTLDNTGDPLLEEFRRHLGPEHVRPGKEDFHFFEFRHGGVEQLASTTAFHVGDDLVWVVGATAPKGDFLADVWRTQALTLVVAACAVLGAVLLAAGMARWVSGPVQALIAFTQRVGDGDLDARADLGGSTEFRRLSDALNRMIADLRDRLRLRHSLDVATQVQQRLLPRRPPRVPGLDIAGHSTYCDETGGDYYDFLVLDEAAPDKLLVALGDVMGHGVAAALVMAGARAVLRDRAGTAGSLSEMLGHINRLLSADHEGTRFMTMHLAVLDVRDGSYRWVSAGHDPALIYDPAAGRFDEIDVGGFPLGIVDDAEYVEQRYGPLRPGQVIVVGTDGVWEMPNTAGEQFGKDRLRQVIREEAANSAAQIEKALLDRLAAFRGECRPADDVTFVVIKIV
jgi:phosphoserine phosphatase RsbU/P